ncbi:hypothetical protein IAQ61_009040 [Plenodomus lingam]|uniref:uncharacterized protein n=1 Tax=Leptosphaeria maculans TaxID=5022 RepID=UPI00331BEB5E|nr:hypothetical protein IAQ61_009040 [Plenodomus lingam]
MAILGMFAKSQASAGASTSPSVKPPDSSVRSFEPVVDEVTAKIINLLAENKRLTRRCEELEIQSQLNQDMFHKCSEALTQKQQECDQLQVLNTSHLPVVEENQNLHGSIATSPQIAAGYEADIRHLQEQLQSARAETEQHTKQIKVQASNFRTLHTTCTSLRRQLATQQKANEEFQEQVMSAQVKGKDSQGLDTDNTQHVQVLEQHIKTLTMRLVEANDQAEERKTVISKLEEEQQKNMALGSIHRAMHDSKIKEFEAEICTLHTRHTQEISLLRTTMEEERSELEANISKLQDQLHAITKSATSPPVRRDSKLDDEHSHLNDQQTDIERSSKDETEDGSVSSANVWGPGCGFFSVVVPG